MGSIIGVIKGDTRSLDYSSYLPVFRVGVGSRAGDSLFMARVSDLGFRALSLGFEIEVMQLSGFGVSCLGRVASLGVY